MAKGVKGGSSVGPPRRYFGRNHRKSVETAQPLRQKAIQGLLSRFQWSPGPSIFDGFLADLNRALSALFSKLGSAGRRRAPEGSPRAPRGREIAPRCWEIAQKFWKNCSEILDLGLGIWTLDKQSGAWHSLSRALAPLSGAWTHNF